MTAVSIKLNILQCKKESAVAVSYTHLDVYKRQHLHFFFLFFVQFAVKTYGCSHKS